MPDFSQGLPVSGQRQHAPESVLAGYLSLADELAAQCSHQDEANCMPLASDSQEALRWFALANDYQSSAGIELKF